MSYSKTNFDLTTKIWSGSKIPTIYNSSVGVGYLALNILQNTPNEITQVSYDTGIEITCSQMYKKAINMASYLQRIGCKTGDIVGLVGRNSDNLAPVVFACLTLGLPINSLTTYLAKDDITFFYSDTKPKLIFCDANVLEKVTNVLKELPFVSEIVTIDKKVNEFKFVGDILDDDFKAQSFVMPQIDPNSVAFILSTSGTTSRPKQVCKSHKQLIEESTAQWKSKISSKEIYLGYITIDWISGIWILLIGTLYCAKRVITIQIFDPYLVHDIITKYDVTTTFMVPALLQSLLRIKAHPLTSIRALTVGGAKVSKDLRERSKFKFPNCEVYHCYACTEASFLAVNFSNEKLESVGQVYRNVEMKIVNDDGVALGVAEIGEIVYKKPTIFSGYFNNAVATNEAIKNGWVFSGDMGYFDEEGYLFITDRRSDIIKYNGHISPSELESIIKRIPDVTDVVVVAACAETFMGDIIYAFVVKKPDSDVCEKFIEDYVSERVEDRKRIRGGVHFVNSFPLNNNGKVLRFEIRKWAQEKYNNSKCC